MLLTKLVVKPFHIATTYLFITLYSYGCMTDKSLVPETQVTHDAKGHCLNSTQCFSPDGKMIVYDTRNVDSALASNGGIGVVHLETGEDRLVYQTTNQSEFGPGVGAATFSPVANKVLFLAGIRNADASRPYSITRRTGFSVDLDIANNNKIDAGNEFTAGVETISSAASAAIRMDARDIAFPYTPGALRGGTHAHTWSGDGKWISFTYNDQVLHEAAAVRVEPDKTVGQTNTSTPAGSALQKNAGKRINSDEIIDTRTVGIMFPRTTMVSGADDVENINGTMFSVIISKVVKHPAPGSDDISRAFDECWIGNNGYVLPDGKRQQRAIAFQGELLDDKGNKKTEIFVADIPANLSTDTSIRFSPGTDTTLPTIPAGVKQRRISFTENGVSAVPRHWLRSSADGSLIGYLAKDKKDIIQLWTISPNGGDPVQRTFLDVSVSGPFNFNHTGTAVAFIAGGSVFITRLSDSKTYRVINTSATNGRLVGAVSWSPVANKICYNRYVKSGSSEYLQIFTADIDPDMVGDKSL